MAPLSALLVRSTPERSGLADAGRIRVPGGRLVVHALTGDRPFPATPSLPGLASLVRRVPTWGEVVDALARAGFASLFFEKRGDIHCFRVNGVEYDSRAVPSRRRV